MLLPMTTNSSLMREMVLHHLMKWKAKMLDVFLLKYFDL